MPLGVVAGQQRRVGRTTQNCGQLPGQVVGALDGGVGPPGLERRHGVSAVADQKDSPALELVGYLFVWLPCRSLDDLEIDLLSDGFGEHFAAVLRRELQGGLPLAREVGGDEHAEIVLGHQEYAVHVGILDLNAVAFAQMQDELPPGGTEIDEDDENRQRPVSRCCDVERFPDLAVHTVGGDQKVCPDRLVLAGIQITQHRGDAGVVLFERTQLGPVAHFAATPPCFGDRKSTRLNSSHPSISYAVFCLKKKRKKSRGPGKASGGEPARKEQK